MEGVQYHVPSTIYDVGCKKDFFVEVLIFLSLLVHKHPAAIVVLWASASSPANLSALITGSQVEHCRVCRLSSKV